MDPVLSLLRAIELATEIQVVADEAPSQPSDLSRKSWERYEDAKTEHAEQLGDLGRELADVVLALHEWRSKGGFDPYIKQEPASR